MGGLYENWGSSFTVKIIDDFAVGGTHHNGYDVALLNVGGDSAQNEIFTPGLDESGKPEGPRTGSTNFLWLVKLKPKLFLFYKSKLEESVCRCGCGRKLTRQLVVGLHLDSGSSKLCPTVCYDEPLA